MPELKENPPATNHRPVGFVQPAGGPSLLAAKAINEGRVDEAKRHAAGITDDTLIARAWRALLLALITIEQGELSRAEPLLLEASAMALEESEVPPAHPIESSSRLRTGARALVHLGWLYRRTERCADASRVHLAAHLLREDHGSYEEIWESATELGLDADVARTFEDGQRWHRRAVEAAQSAHEEPLKKQALAWTNLVTSHEAADQVDEAVEVARTAQHCWHQFDSAAVTAVRADAKLGRALLKKGERLCRSGDPDAAPAEADLATAERQNAVEVLGEAVNLLAAARDGLLAFGSEYRNEADSCHDQEELASRLTGTCRPLGEPTPPEFS